MKILVGYNGGEWGRMALSLARDFALKNNAFVYIITSMEGGASEKPSDIAAAEEGLAYARMIMEKSGVECEAQQSVRGMTPWEDIVNFAKENKIDQIFLGIKKISRAQKAILGSTARDVILKAPCPVTTIKFALNEASDLDLLKDRRILVVDDEPDVLETIEEILDMCIVDTAAGFDEARKLLDKNSYDAAILDIMGVSGYDILKLTCGKEIVSIMLTAHALTPENLQESIRKGADAYIPKEELANLDMHLSEAVRAKLKGQGQGSWFSTLKPIFDKTFGAGWRDRDRPFWDSFDDRYGK